jgi:glycosyltransferase involved in cell wall biosynthesis
VIIVDGGSTDGTISVVKNYVDKHPFFKIISEPDKGIYDAMNKGIKMASGEWLYFMGSDDYLFNQQVLADIFQNGNVRGYGVIYGNVSSPALGNKFDGEFNRFKITKHNICHQAIFYHKRVFKELGCYNLDYRVWADWDFNLRCFSKKKIKKKYEDITVAFFASGGFSSREVIDKVFKNDYKDLLIKYGYKKTTVKMKIKEAYKIIKGKFT